MVKNCVSGTILFDIRTGTNSTGEEIVVCDNCVKRSSEERSRTLCYNFATAYKHERASLLYSTLRSHSSIKTHNYLQIFHNAHHSTIDIQK